MSVALALHFAIPFEAVALQAFDDRCLGTGHFPWRIEIFHAQQPATANGAGIQVGGEGGDQRAEMQVAAGCRCEATYIGRRSG